MGEFSLYHLDPWRDCIKRGVGGKGVEKKNNLQDYGAENAEETEEGWRRQRPKAAVVSQ